MGAIGDLFGWIATPLYYAISGVLLVWQKAFSYVIPSEGWQWALAIVGLTVTIRALLIPLFVKQINSSRNMQLLQPKVKELQKKYGHDREKLANETMKLYKDSGTNPFASCLPLLLQMPIFFVLFRLLSHASKGDGKGFLSDADAHEFANSTWLGSLLSDQFTTATHTSTYFLTGVMIVLMIVTQFLTQRQLMSKNMPADAMQGQFAQQQKMLMYVLPFVFAIGGIAFPVGTILYWSSSNLWTMGQQFYVIRNNPAPGTPAFEAKQERDKAKRKRKGDSGDAAAGGSTGSAGSADSTAVATDKRPAQRTQPKNQTRSQRKKAGSGAGRSTTQKNGGSK